MIKYVEQMKTLLEYNKYLQQPSMCGQLDLEADWYKRENGLT